VGRLSCGFIADRIGAYIPLDTSHTSYPTSGILLYLVSTAPPTNFKFPLLFSKKYHLKNSANRCNKRHDTRVILREYIDLSMALPARDRRARDAGAAVWRVARRVRGALQCADDRSWRFFRRRASHRHVPYRIIPLLARGSADIGCHLSLYGWVLWRRDIRRSVFSQVFFPGFGDP
jgi:hypothetical protein